MFSGKRLGLKVKPISGESGNSNNGNVARRAFEDSDLFVHCLGLDSEFIQKFKIILIILILSSATRSHSF